MRSAWGLTTVFAGVPRGDPAFTENCQPDYESFTDSCLPADMTLSGHAFRSGAAAPSTNMGTHNDQLKVDSR